MANNWLADGAEVATILTGLSAVSAPIIWGRNQLEEHKQCKAKRQLRDWHGYINPGSINGWHVRLVVDPPTPTSLVVLEVLDSPGGDGSAGQAQNMRQHVITDQMLSRSPTPGEHRFIMAIYSQRRDSGFPIRDREEGS